MLQGSHQGLCSCLAACIWFRLYPAEDNACAVRLALAVHCLVAASHVRCVTCMLTGSLPVVVLPRLVPSAPELPLLPCPAAWQATSTAPFKCASA